MRFYVFAFLAFPGMGAQIPADRGSRRPFPLAGPNRPMETVLIAIHLVIVLALAGVVLLQRSVASFEGSMSRLVSRWAHAWSS